jgi:hypothetical protein
VIFLPNDNYSGLIQERDVLVEPAFGLSLDGQNLGYDFLRWVQQVQYQDEEDAIAMLIVTVLDPTKIWLNDISVKKGKALNMSMGHQASHHYFMSGVITHVDAEFTEEGYASLNIIAMQNGVWLNTDRKTRTFKNAKVSDVVKLMLKEAGIQNFDVQDTGTVMDYIPQENETNLEFITRWRKKLYWRFFRCSDDSWFFGKERVNFGKVKTLGYKTGGMEIVSFTPSYQDVEVDESNAPSSDIDNSGAVATYTVNTKNNTAVYAGLNNSSEPIGTV